MTTTDDVLVRLRRFSQERDRFKAAVARSTGTSAAEFSALDHLEAQGGSMTPGQIAERLSLTTGAVTALIDRLERVGWVRRERHPHDRRSVLVVLTDAARRRAEAELGDWVADNERAARRLSAAERETVSRFLDEAADIAARHADRRAAERGAEGADRPPGG